MGNWYSPEHILEKAKTYEKVVTQIEPRNRATAWHAHESCRCCGSCVMYGRRSSACPSVLNPKSVVLSPQGYGPARNIVAFTGGDITCCPEFYGECACLIKENTKLWVLLETNGYGLTPNNLDYLQRSGVDSFWLDIKAFYTEKHKWLTGCSNKHILKFPEELRRRDFVLEVLSLYILGVVETEELEKIAQLISAVDSEIPFTLLAFFPEYRMQKFPSPTAVEMVSAYRKIKAAGLKNVRLWNLSVIVRTEADQKYLIENVDTGAF
jgi:pyruvate-formate lyase-activating enzyme